MSTDNFIMFLIIIVPLSGAIISGLMIYLNWLDKKPEPTPSIFRAGNIVQLNNGESATVTSVTSYGITVRVAGCEHISVVLNRYGQCEQWPSYSVRHITGHADFNT